MRKNLKRSRGKQEHEVWAQKGWCSDGPAKHGTQILLTEIRSEKGEKRTSGGTGVTLQRKASLRTHDPQKQKRLSLQSAPVTHAHHKVRVERKYWERVMWIDNLK